MLSGAAVGGKEQKGLAATLLYSRFEDTTGVVIGGWNRVDFDMRGIQIGLLNKASNVHGLQIGLLNNIEENPSWQRWLPFVNW